MYLFYVTLVIIIVAQISSAHNNEKLSYVVTSKPYYMQTSVNVNKLERDLNHDNIGDNEINETNERIQNDCETSNSCGNEDFRTVGYDATFKPFPQDELEKILKKYGSNKIIDRVSNSKINQNGNEISSTLPFVSVTTESAVPDKSKGWSLVSAQTNNDNQETQSADRVGWVTLEPVAWSTSQIQKWRPNIQTVPSKDDSNHWNNNPINTNSQLESFKWNSNTQTWNSGKPIQVESKPHYEFYKPSYMGNKQSFDQMKQEYVPMKNVYDPLRPTYDSLKPIYDSLKPTYESLRPTHDTIQGTFESSQPSYNSDLTINSYPGHNFESTKQSHEHHNPIKPNIEKNTEWTTKKQNFYTKPTNTNIQFPSNHHHDKLEPQIITSQTENQYNIYIQSKPQLNKKFKPWETFEQNNQISQQVDKPLYSESQANRRPGNPSEAEGHWVLLSSTKEYSDSDRQRSLSRSLKDKEFYKNAIALTITPHSSQLSPKFNARTLTQKGDYKNYIPLSEYPGNGTEYRRKTIPLIITASNMNEQTRSEKKIDINASNEPKNNSRTARRMVRLTVLPALNQSSIVTSHNGMIEVENTKLTVDESHREHLARMIKFENKQDDLRNKLSNRIQRDVKLDDAMSAPLPVSKMTMLMPIVIGRRRRRYDTNHKYYYPNRKIITSTY